MKVFEPKECALCKKNSGRFEGHHLSYDPEIVIRLCYRCHKIIHGVARLTDEQFRLMMDWIFKYRDEWVDGTQKHLKSEYRRRISTANSLLWRERNPERYKAIQKRWNEKRKKAYAEAKVHSIRAVANIDA
jgi:hypothetical protein